VLLTLLAPFNKYFLSNALLDRNCEIAATQLALFCPHSEAQPAFEPHPEYRTTLFSLKMLIHM
jgi:hypothetical protein